MNVRAVTSGNDPHAIYGGLPDLGHELISEERFTSPVIMKLEWERLWSRVLNMGPRVEEIPAAGDYVLHSLGRESLIFIRNSNNEIYGFYNVCPHRGNRICTAERAGRRRLLVCGYHNWRWDLEGNCRSIPDQADFPQLRESADQAVVGLSKVKVAEWAGWIWFNLNPDCGSLEDFLHPVKQRIDPYRVEAMRFLDFKTFEWPCNWKIANDAFNESFLFAATHPEMIRYSEHVSRQELIGDHSLMEIPYGTVDSQLPDRKRMNPYLAEWMARVYKMDANSFSNEAANVRLHHQRDKRQNPCGFADYDSLSDEQITDDHAFLIFPNINWQMSPEAFGGYRIRPHETDPNRCYFDLYFLRHIPEGSEPPAWQHEVLHWPIEDLQAKTTIARLSALAVEQDARKHVQRGMHSAGFRGQILGNQEIRLRHFYQTLDRYLAHP
jgi:phenylpropionate dioxygenase-like ring-hydroxylating dioxygenase large terminal subunit